MKRLLLVSLVLLVLAACDSTATDPAPVVEQYLQAKVAGDKDKLAQLLCSAMESDLNREAASFASVDAHIEDMACTADGELVTCSGQIVALYGKENRNFPLSTYRVVQEDGEWRWCGEG
ncbi:MAG: hypothetical protein H6672_14000 [Anaerolineaceae bacterium]|nr:hypothetical protein [Anaerolineaceae bacterium]